jgi:hypothetical protein
MYKCKETEMYSKRYNVAVLEQISVTAGFGSVLYCVTCTLCTVYSSMQTKVGRCGSHGRTAPVLYFTVIYYLCADGCRQSWVAAATAFCPAQPVARTAPILHCVYLMTFVYRQMQKAVGICGYSVLSCMSWYTRQNTSCTVLCTLWPLCAGGCRRRWVAVGTASCPECPGMGGRTCPACPG